MHIPRQNASKTQNRQSRWHHFIHIDSYFKQSTWKCRRFLAPTLSTTSIRGFCINKNITLTFCKGARIFILQKRCESWFIQADMIKLTISTQRNHWQSAYFIWIFPKAINVNDCLLSRLRALCFACKFLCRILWKCFLFFLVGYSFKLYI